MTELDISQFPGAIRSSDAAIAARIARFQKNLVGRDFVVGDVHGMFLHLQQLLDSVEFDPRLDRLFSVGDLVDRGPASHEALNWLDQQWFCACRGNHEQFALESDDAEQLELWVNYNGGEWWLKLDEQQQQLFRSSFAKMPLAIEVMTAVGVVGIVHADVHPHCSWANFTELLESGDEDALFYALWSRMRVSGEICHAVAGGVDRVYCGHTPTKETVQVGNVWFIDTGAVYSCEGYQGARLTLVQIHPEPHIEYDIRT